MENARILVVEDEVIVAKDIKRGLKKLGYGVSAVVSSGADAIEKAKEERPDLILMDIGLEGKMDGIEAADYILSNLDIPVVYLTAYSDKKTLERAKITEPFGYVIKPYEDRELYVAVEIGLYKYRMEKKLKESEARYSSFVAATSKVVWIVKPDEEVCSGIPTWKAFLTRRGAEPETIHPDDIERTKQIFSDAVTNKSYFETDFRIKSGGERYQHLFIKGVPILEKNGGIREWIGSCAHMK